MSNPTPLARRVILSLFGLAALFVAIPGGWFIYYRVSNAKAVRKLEAAVRAKSEPLTLAELAASYPPIPEVENSALPLIEAWRNDNPKKWDAFLRGDPTLPPDSRPNRTDPDLPWRGSNARRIPRTELLNAKSRAALEAELQTTGARRTAVRAALRRPRFQFPTKITNAYSALLPHLSEMKRDMQTFQLEALQALEAGEIDRALNSLATLRAVADRLGKEPFLLGQLVRVAGYSMLLDSVELTLSRAKLTGPQRKTLAEMVAGIDLTGALTRAFRAERAAMLGIYHDPAAFFAAAAQDSVDGAETEIDSKLPAAGIKVFGALGIGDLDQRLMLETMAEALVLAEDEQAIPEQRLNQLYEAAGRRATGFPARIFAGMLLPALGKAGDRFAAIEAKRRAALLALAIEDYRVDREGSLPPTLFDLPAALTDGVRRDPFSGASLIFKARDAGYVIYSLGPDRRDDGGRERPTKGQAPYDVTFIVEH